MAARSLVRLLWRLSGPDNPRGRAASLADAMATDDDQGKARSSRGARSGRSPEWEAIKKPPDRSEGRKFGIVELAELKHCGHYGEK